MLRCIYRYCPFDNPGNRPEWFSKDVALASFFQALLFMGQFIDLKLTFIIDWFEVNSRIEKLIEYATLNFGAEIHIIHLHNNCGSYRTAYNLALEKSQFDDLILMAEDDYIWTEESLISMVCTMKELVFCDYLTPYDHPVRYDFSYIGGVDLNHWESRIFLSHNRHYRSQESTCMTFISRANILKEDRDVHFLFTPVEKKSPNDRELFRQLQHLGQYKNNNLYQPRLLLGPIPSLATHAHKLFLAPCINWESIVQQTRKIWQKILIN